MVKQGGNKYITSNIVCQEVNAENNLSFPDENLLWCQILKYAS